MIFSFLSQMVTSDAPKERVIIGNNGGHNTRDTEREWRRQREMLTDNESETRGKKECYSRTSLL